MRLAKEAHIDADIVSTVPDSATAASHGYAQKVCPFYIQLFTDATKFASYKVWGKMVDI